MKSVFRMRDVHIEPGCGGKFSEDYILYEYNPRSMEGGGLVRRTNRCENDSNRFRSAEYP